MADFDGFVLSQTASGGGTIQFRSQGANTSFAGFVLPAGATTTINPVVLQNLYPVQGAEILVTQKISFELVRTLPASIGPLGQGRVIIWVQYPDLNGGTEVAYDGSGFTPAFSGQSSTQDLTSAIRKFSILRNGGWPSRPKLFVHANTDLGGLNT